MIHQFNVLQGGLYQKVTFDILKVPKHRKRIMSEAEYHQAMLERMQQLEEALKRAESGQATNEDWNVIYYECGIRRAKNESDRQSK